MLWAQEDLYRVITLRTWGHADFLAPGQCLFFQSPPGSSTLFSHIRCSPGLLEKLPQGFTLTLDSPKSIVPTAARVISLKCKSDKFIHSTHFYWELTVCPLLATHGVAVKSKALLALWWAEKASTVTNTCHQLVLRSMRKKKAR